MYNTVESPSRAWLRKLPKQLKASALEITIPTFISSSASGIKYVFRCFHLVVMPIKRLQTKKNMQKLIIKMMTLAKSLYRCSLFSHVHAPFRHTSTVLNKNQMDLFGNTSFISSILEENWTSNQKAVRNTKTLLCFFISDIDKTCVPSWSICIHFSAKVTMAYNRNRKQSFGNISFVSSILEENWTMLKLCLPFLVLIMHKKKLFLTV